MRILDTLAWQAIRAESEQLSATHETDSHPITKALWC